MSKPDFVIIATDGLTTDLLYQQLSSIGNVKAIFIEQRDSVMTKFKKRLKKVSIFSVIGQIMFLLLIYPFLKIGSGNRRNQLVRSFGYQMSSSYVKQEIPTINDINLPEKINSLNPDFIFINGTRIVKKDVLQKFNKPVMNIHVGITPAYRGIHGGYWALYNKDRQHFGVTFHFVDAGIDTGKIIAQKIIDPGKNNFVTYPILQYLEGLQLVKRFFDENHHSTGDEFSKSESRLYYHPRFFQYLTARIFSGIR